MKKNTFHVPKVRTLADDSLPDTFGSARFMEPEEADKLGLTLEGKGRKFCPYIGCFVVLHKQTSRTKFKEVYARSISQTNFPSEDQLDPGVGHMITFAPTRAGKGAGQIIMNLLMWEGSALVLDVKGENYFYSAGFRSSELGHAVFRFAPFEEYTDIWNPILAIRGVENWSESTWKERCEEEEDARYLANLVIATSGSKNDVFWEDKAKSLLVGLLLYVRTTIISESDTYSDDANKQHLVRERSMREVTRLVSLGHDSFESLLHDMSDSPRTLVNQVGRSFLGYLEGEGKLGVSIKSMLLKQMDVWAYERVHRATYKGSGRGGEPGANDFSFSQMRDGKVSLYLIIPPEYLSEYCSVLRAMVGCAIRELKDSYNPSKKNPAHAESPPVLFLLDEFAQLAHMGPIEDGLTYLAGYGVRFWFFLQDIEQLKTNYPQSWQSILANTDVKSFFGVNDINTAKLVSETAGTCTVESSSLTKPLQGNASANTKPCDTVSYSYTARNLITPGEVMNMPVDKELVFFKGLKPMYLDLPRFYNIEGMIKLSDLKPPHDVDFYL